MGNERCFLCSAKRDSKTTLHGFPPDPPTRSAWIRFCSLNESIDDVTKLYLCSSHFVLNDYGEPQAKELGSVLKLRPKSIPSILRPKGKKKHILDPEAKGSQPPAKKITYFKSEFLDPGEGTSHSAQESSESVFLKEGQKTPKSLLQPRCVGGIRSPDVCTPCRAKRCLFAATTKISKQKSQIRTLQQRNRRLEKKCRTLKDVLSHLKAKNLIADD